MVTEFTAPSAFRFSARASIGMGLLPASTFNSEVKRAFISFSKVSAVPLRHTRNRMIPLPRPSHRWTSLINLRRVYFFFFAILIRFIEKSQPHSQVRPGHSKGGTKNFKKHRLTPRQNSWDLFD